MTARFKINGKMCSVVVGNQDGRVYMVYKNTSVWGDSVLQCINKLSLKIGK